jgi:hypothetical protein
MKTLFERIGHLPTTAAGLLLITVAVAHFTGIVTIGEMTEFFNGLDALLILLGIGGIASKGWGKI